MSPRAKRNPYDPPHRIGRILLYTLAVLIAVLLVAVLAGVLLSRSRGEPPSVFGFSVYIVSGDSMEATISSGDALLTRRVDPETLREGDVITFSLGTDAQGREQVDTRRITAVFRSENGISFQVQGDNLPEPDPELCTGDRVLGKGLSSMPGLGNFFAFVKTPLGLISCIALPLGILLIFEIISLCRSFRRSKEQEPEEEVSPLARAVRMRQEAKRQERASRPLEYAFPQVEDRTVPEAERGPAEPLRIPPELSEAEEPPEAVRELDPPVIPQPQRISTALPATSTQEFAPPAPPPAPAKTARPERFRIEGVDVQVKDDAVHLSMEDGTVSVTVTGERTKVAVAREGREVRFDVVREGNGQKLVIRRSGAPDQEDTP